MRWEAEDEGGTGGGERGETGGDGRGRGDVPDWKKKKKCKRAYGLPPPTGARSPAGRCEAKDNIDQ